MIVKEVMNENVITVDPESSIRDALTAMIDNDVGSVIAIKNNKILGILTDKDILIPLAKNHLDIDQIKVKDIMTHWVITINPDNPIEKAIDLMIKNKIKKLPVVENEKLVGIITTNDIAVVHPKLIEKLANLLSVKR